jgi:hypothetical protein
MADHWLIANWMTAGSDRYGVPTCSPMCAQARTAAINWSAYSVSGCSAVSPGTRTKTTPSDCAAIQPCAGWSAVAHQWVRRLFAAMRILPILRYTSSSKPRAWATRRPPNRVLQDKIGYLLKRPVGRPPHEARRYHASFSYQAQRWKELRRVVAKVGWHSSELYPRVGFVITNPGTAGRAHSRLLQPARHGGAMDQRKQG